MRRAASIAALLMTLSGCSGGGGASPWSTPPTLAVDVRVTVEPTEVALLHPVTVTVDRYRRDGVEATFAPAFDDKVWVEQARQDTDERALGDGHWQRSTFTLLPIDGPGERRVPAFRVETVVADGDAPEVATTEEVVVLVTSTLSDAHGAEIEAPGEPFATPLSWWWWAGAAAALLLVAGWVLLSRRRRAPRPEHLTIDAPAHIRALRELQRWRTAPRTTPQEIEAFYVGVSQVLRVYLEERFGLHAPERTTEEFLRDLEAGDELVREHRDELEHFLSQCDMVKFARHVPTGEEHDLAFSLAEAFVESTRVDRAPERDGVGGLGGDTGSGLGEGRLGEREVAS
ncbi:MAG: DUF4381 family protein [Planctomycetota bacterium]